MIWSTQPRPSFFQIELAQLSRLDLGFCSVPHVIKRRGEHQRKLSRSVPRCGSDRDEALCWPSRRIRAYARSSMPMKRVDIGAYPPI